MKGWDPCPVEIAWPHDGDDCRRYPEIFKRTHHFMTGVHDMWADRAPAGRKTDRW